MCFIVQTAFFTSNPKSKIVIHLFTWVIFLVSTIFAYLVLQLLYMHTRNYMLGMTSNERMGMHAKFHKIDITQRFNKDNNFQTAASEPLIEMRHYYNNIVKTAKEKEDWKSEGMSLIAADSRYSTAHNCGVMCCENSSIPQDELRDQAKQAYMSTSGLADQFILQRSVSSLERDFKDEKLEWDKDQHRNHFTHRKNQNSNNFQLMATLNTEESQIDDYRRV